MYLNFVFIRSIPFPVIMQKQQKHTHTDAHTQNIDQMLYRSSVWYPNRPNINSEFDPRFYNIWSLNGQKIILEFIQSYNPETSNERNIRPEWFHTLLFQNR